MPLRVALQTCDALVRLLHGERKTIPAIAHGDGALQGSRAFPTDHDWRSGALDRTRVGCHLAERSEGAMVLRMLHRPKRAHRTQSVVHPLAAPLHWNAERPKFRFQPACAHSDNEAACGNNVETRQFLGENRRITEGHENNAARQTKALRMSGDPGQGHRRIEHRSLGGERKGRGGGIGQNNVLAGPN